MLLATSFTGLPSVLSSSKTTHNTHTKRKKNPLPYKKTSNQTNPKPQLKYKIKAQKEAEPKST